MSLMKEYLSRPLEALIRMLEMGSPKELSAAQLAY